MLCTTAETVSICTLVSVINFVTVPVKGPRGDGYDKIYTELALDTVKPLVSNHTKCEDLKRSLTASLQELVPKRITGGRSAGGLYREGKGM